MQRSTPTPKKSFGSRNGASHSEDNSVTSSPVALEFRAPQKEYSYRLSFYSDPPPPDAEIDLEEFQEWAIDRVQVLDALDSCLTSAPSEIERTMRPVLSRYLPFTRHTNIKQTIDKELMKDNFSHYFLRLSFCQKPEDRKRFVKLETALFKLRYNLEPIEARAKFLNDLNLNWEKATPEEAQALEQEMSFSKLTDAPASSGAILYKFPMEDCMDLLGKRLVIVKKGIAYVPETYQLNLLAREFSRSLTHALVQLSKKVPEFKEDGRLDGVLKLANEGFTNVEEAADFQITANTQLTYKSLDSLEKENHLPLCMSRLYDNLKKTKHAYYSERNQFLRFLKYIGMPLEEAIKLYSAFYMDYDKKKDIEYSIKHWYGVVGSRKTYQPETCVSICKNSEYNIPNRASGCPFFNCQSDVLERLLRNHGIQDEQGIQEIKRFSDENQVHLACSKTYELTHPKDNTKHESVSLPNQYFERSWNSAIAEQQNHQQNTESSQTTAEK
ncbi:DNA primase subunit [Starmerella bacillaris]|uniref:DNA primase subunit n=1 Tax=Starmerella bacillaris TaxID=1247836 RepID=A0AAV5RL16_STABA|nr:DNA primase subunit [Starmerella bacillaris]